MYYFNNDYSEIAAPEILAALAREASTSQMGYGLDDQSRVAAELIRRELSMDSLPTEAIHFVVGGTQANLLLIGSVLKSYEAVIAVETAHINVHETGAIEGQGHKVLTAKSQNGKLSVAAIESIVHAHRDEHMVKPRMVYISQTTELGTIYQHAELAALRDCCDRLGLYLYVDGARIASAVEAETADLSLADIASFSDAFTIGGTKNGLLFGEALVLVRPEWQRDFRYEIKHRGAMLAKGFISGIQFRALFEDGLFYRLARHANQQAMKLAAAMSSAGIDFSVEPQSNQLFPILSQSQIQKLQRDFVFSIQDEINDSHSIVRFVCSWATSDEAVTALTHAIRSNEDQSGAK